MLDANIIEVTDICNTITDAIYKNNDNLNSNTQKIQDIIPNQPDSVTCTIDIIRSTAKGLDELSINLERNTPLLKSSFFSMIDNTNKIKALVVDFICKEENIQEEYKIIGELLICISTIKSKTISYKASVGILPPIEQNFTISQKRLSENLESLIFVLDECISKGQELVRSIL
jgi:hypothetical protein